MNSLDSRSGKLDEAHRPLCDKNAGSTLKVASRTLITEAIICFALPTYLWLLGLITAPFWYFAAARAGTLPFWTAGYVLGGGFGLAALISFVRYLLARDVQPNFSLIRNVVFASFGLLSIWGYVTTDFEYFDIDGFTGLAAGLPSLCFAHLMFLASSKAKALGSSTLVRDSA